MNEKTPLRRKRVFEKGSDICIERGNDEDDDRVRGVHSYQKPKRQSETIQLKSCDGDYYEWMANTSEVRPISITEGLEWSSMSNLHKIFWWVNAFIQLMILAMFDFRTDRLHQRNYMKHHLIHYSGIFLYPYCTCL